jgi:hypothetical protein
VALGTATLTVAAFWASPIEAGADADTPPAKLAKPRFVSHGIEPLNAAARKVWESLGYEIRPVDCTSAYRHFGCLHCLVNVLYRS